MYCTVYGMVHLNYDPIEMMKVYDLIVFRKKLRKNCKRINVHRKEGTNEDRIALIALV